MKLLGIMFVSLLFLGCGPVSQIEDGYGQVEQEYNSNPPPKLICDYPNMACGGKICVDVSRDRNNCGWCGVKCEKMEICYAYHCVGPEAFGFSEGNLVRGPVPYVPKKDLPRPNPMQTVL
jgi:hypothetical protein